MALIKCPECGREVSDTANACINCGYDIKTYVDKIEKAKKEEEMKAIEEEQIKTLAKDIKLPKKNDFFNSEWGLYYAGSFISGALFVIYVIVCVSTNEWSSWLILALAPISIITFCEGQKIKKKEDEIIEKAIKDEETYKINKARQMVNEQKATIRRIEYKLESEIKCPYCGIGNPNKVEDPHNHNGRQWQCWSCKSYF